ncbi:MAG: UDP binding domain-containing protein, partial [Janthinobacterium lividum]
AKIRAFDPEGVEQARLVLTDVDYAKDPYDCVTGADVAVLMTEWDAFRALDMDRVRQAMARPSVVDLRNVYRPDEMARRGIAYTSVGR